MNSLPKKIAFRTWDRELEVRIEHERAESARYRRRTRLIWIAVFVVWAVAIAGRMTPDSLLVRLLMGKPL